MSLSDSAAIYTYESGTFFTLLPVDLQKSKLKKKDNMHIHKNIRNMKTTALVNRQ